VVIAAIVDSYVYNAWGQIAQKQEWTIPKQLL
jgi:hypothetical protein